MRNILENVILRPEHGVHAVIEHGVETSCCFGGIEGPLLLSGYKIHPEVGSKGINVQTTVGSCLNRSDIIYLCIQNQFHLSDEKTGPAVVVKRLPVCHLQNVSFRNKTRD